VRTTLTLDDDVAANLRRAQAESGTTWRQLVNDSIRAGLVALEQSARSAPRATRTTGVRLGRPLSGDISNVHEVLAVAEGDSRK
jgi:hypothetical protein